MVSPFFLFHVQRCRTLLMKLEKGFVPDQIQLTKTLSNIVEVLCSDSNQADSKW